LHHFYVQYKHQKWRGERERFSTWSRTAGHVVLMRPAGSVKLSCTSFQPGATRVGNSLLFSFSLSPPFSLFIFPALISFPFLCRLFPPPVSSISCRSVCHVISAAALLCFSVFPLPSRDVHEDFVSSTQHRNCLHHHTTPVISM